METGTAVMLMAASMAAGGFIDSWVKGRGKGSSRRTVVVAPAPITTPAPAGATVLWLMGANGEVMHEVTIHSAVPDIYQYAGRTFVRFMQRPDGDGSWDFVEQGQGRGQGQEQESGQ